jgi:hypothetical protein
MDAALDLTTLDEALDYLDIAGVIAPDDDVLGALITGVSGQIQAYLDRRLVSQPYAATLSGHGGDRLMLPHYPISAIASLKIDNQSVPAASAAVAAGFVFDGALVGLRDYCFARGIMNVEIAYTAGFAVIPADAALACHLGLRAALEVAQSESAAAIKYKAGDTEIAYGGDVAKLAELCLTPGVTALVNAYRRVAPC